VYSSLANTIHLSSLAIMEKDVHLYPVTNASSDSTIKPCGTSPNFTHAAPAPIASDVRLVHYPAPRIPTVRLNQPEIRTHVSSCHEMEMGIFIFKERDGIKRHKYIFQASLKVFLIRFIAPHVKCWCGCKPRKATT
jgi:hypothetical protein